MGAGARATPQAQVDKQCSEQVKASVLRAIRRIPDTNNSDASFAAIKQGATEPQITFLGRLSNVLGRRVENPAARGILLRHLATGNAAVGNCRDLRKPLTPR